MFHSWKFCEGRLVCFVNLCMMGFKQQFVSVHIKQSVHVHVGMLGFLFQLLSFP
jgi:hypothetical protein